MGLSEGDQLEAEVVGGGKLRGAGNVGGDDGRDLGVAAGGWVRQP